MVFHLVFHMFFTCVFYMGFICYNMALICSYVYVCVYIYIDSF